DGGDPDGPELIKSTPARFDARGLDVVQHFATSDDGTRVPYFEISGKDAAARGTDGPAPTLLFGYGGFEISLTPGYLGAIGKAWLERGGTYVLANIRGGGEYGPRCHQAALKENRHRAYEDFSSVARDLIERGVTDIHVVREYVPPSHQAALKENRPLAYEDFPSVARDLIERVVTDRDHLAVRGVSNGGLLTGNMVTSYPELFGAVVIQVPLLDMKR